MTIKDTEKMDTPKECPKEKEIIYVPSPFPQDMDEDEIDLLELWNILWRGKWFVMGFSLLCTIAAVLVSLYVLPVIYKSEAVLQPTQSSGGAGKLASLVGSLPIPIDLPGGGDGDAGNITAFLTSRSLKQRLIEKYDLLPRLHKDIWVEETKSWDVDDPEDRPTVILALQEEKLKDIYTAEQDQKTNLITLTWSDEDPAFSALMLERIIEELQYYLDNDYEFKAKREREFVERQLAQALVELQRWERQVPTETISLSTITREKLTAQTVYTELRKQLELAKITEARELISFKVLDPPFVPEKKDKPKRALICALTMVGSGFLAVLIVFIRHAVRGRREE